MDEILCAPSIFHRIRRPVDPDYVHKVGVQTNKTPARGRKIDVVETGAPQYN